ncbi:MAG: hypothetical protein V4510_12950 [bacterium]
MTLRKATISVTTDSFGYGETDTRITPTAATRPSVLRAVQMTESPGGAPQVSLNELNYDSVELEYDIGDSLFYSATLGDGVMRHVQGPAVVDDTDTAVSSGETGEVYIDVTHVRCSVDAGVPSSSYTVVVYYETAGDYRF